MEREKLSFSTDSSSRQLVRVPVDSPSPPFIVLTNVVLIDNNDPPRRVDITLTLSPQILGELVRDAAKRLAELRIAIDT